MSPSYDSIANDPLILIGSHSEPRRSEALWFRVGGYLATGVLVAVVWFLKVVPDDRTSQTTMIQPANELLSSFVQPAENISSLSGQVGFPVRVPDLKSMGIQMKTFGEAEFGGRPAAVIQYEQNGASYLLYTYNPTTPMSGDMRKVDADGHQFFVTSGGDVSVVAWKDEESRYHALAAKATEQSLLAFAERIQHLS